MEEKSFYIVSISSLLTTIGLAILGEYYKSVEFLFNVMLTLVGVLAGILTSLFFSKQQERENLSKYASSAYRLSSSVYSNLTDIIESIEKITSNRNTENEILLIRLEEMENKLRMVNKTAIAANDNWREFLPKDVQTELLTLEAKTKERTKSIVPLSEKNTLVITKKEISL